MPWSPGCSPCWRMTNFRKPRSQSRGESRQARPLRSKLREASNHTDIYIQGAVRAETARAKAERVETQEGMRRKRRNGSRARVRW
jgi:hypothetical protein